MKSFFMVKGARYFLVGCWLFLTHFGLAQNPLEKTVTIELLSQSVGESLEQIQLNGGFYFSYNSSIINTNKVIDVKSKGRTVKEVLIDLIGEDYQFLHRGSYIIIKPFNKPSKTEKKEVKVRGAVLDARTGKKLENVTIYEVSNFKSALSNNDGSYNLNTSADEEYIEIAISKEAYKDTIIQVSAIEAQLIEITLTPLPDTAIVTEQDALSTNRVVNFFMNDQARWNNRNVKLTEESPFQVSFVPFVGTNMKLSGKVTNKASINVIGGYSHQLEGFEVGGVFNMVKTDVSGVQIGGVGNIVGGRTSGTQISGIHNINKDKVEGVQIAGVTNIVRDTASGFQTSGVINIANTGNGVQLAGFSNVVSQRYKGVQTAGFLNVSKKVSGAQVSGFANINTQEVKGAQISALFNYTKKLSGIQLGVFNVVDSVAKGVPIGVFSYVKNGFHQFEAVHDDVMHSRLLFKTGTHRLYNILGAGAAYHGNSSLWSYTYGLGTQFFMGKKEKWYSNIEITGSNIQRMDQWTDGVNIVGDLNLVAGYQLNKRVSINAGPVLHVYTTNIVNPDSGNLGFDIANNPFYDETFSNSTRVQMWAGYKAGIRF